MQRSMTVLMALSGKDERLRVSAVIEQNGDECVFAESILDVEAAMGSIDVVLTDTTFADGSFADWLSLWPVPAVLVADPEADPLRLASLIADESSTFCIRDPEGNWERFAPILLRKAVAVRESLDRQNVNIVRAESSYMNLLRMVPDIVYVLDSDGCFAYLNDAIVQLGWKPSELIGRHFAEVVHPDDVSEVGRNTVLRRYEGVTTGTAAAPKLFDERRSGDRMTKGLEVRLRHKDEFEWTRASVDSWGEIASLGVKLPEFQGRGTGTIGIIHDVSERREAARQLARELDSRELLLKEIHHRVKNNLQVVSSLLSLEGDCITDEGSRGVFTDCQTQIHSMALVHEQIYRGSSFDGIDAAAYFARLAEYMAGVHDAQDRNIHIEVSAPSLMLPIDTAIPLSIIVTELLSNAFKHGFPDGRAGKICIAMEVKDGQYGLSVSDNGVGFGYSAPGTEVEKTQPDKAKPDKAKIPGRKGIGMDIIGALASQLGGTFEQSGNEGARSTLSFPVVRV
jgi:PAS domain S-box-containing protein